ncbi:cytochrome P450 [Suillus subaureus]|uniref:Cytochrome P450 n=1 Tax=Suillus subaureus TaxID=48587 RepID=A0A9P7E1N1_9AGAM|nr:cytochrome P450 [Suillus subaureus]KAG1809091.1 cytochrome P450 [Suillus subaureus]
MITPGISFLGRTVVSAGSLYFGTVCLARFATRSGISLPPWILLLGATSSLPIGFALRILYVGIVVVDKLQEWVPALRPLLRANDSVTYDIMLKLMDRFNNGYPGDGLAEIVAEFGSCFNLHVMFEDVIFTVEPSHIKTILASEFENYVKGDKFRHSMSSVLGTGVFNSDGEMWKFHRSMTRPFFSHDRISHFNTFDRYAEDAITQMKARFRAGYPVDFQDLMSRFTLDSATEFLFGNCVHSLSAGLPYPHNISTTEALTGKAKIAQDFAQAFADAQTIIAQRPRKSWVWPLFEIFKDATAAPMQIVNSFIDPILKEAIAKKQSHTSGKKNVDDDDTTLLDQLVQMTTDPVVLKDEILNILIAGRDTTAGTLTVALYLLSTHPHVMTRLREEVMTKVGPTDRPTYDNIREMKYLRAVINETMRVFSPVPFNVRESVKASTLPATSPLDKPIYVPPKTSVSYSVFLMHRRKDLWGPDADEFDPDRFLDERLHKYLTPKPFIFLPFNAGPRICLGQQFAYNEMSFMLIRLLQSFSSITLHPEAQHPDTLPPADWAQAEGRKSREQFWPKAHLTMYAHGGLWVRMTEAENAD